MSRDVRYLLHYEPQPYANSFPQPVIEELNNDPNIYWMDSLVKVGSGYDYMGWANRSDDKYIFEKSKADQILISTDTDDRWRLYPNE